MEIVWEGESLWGEIDSRDTFEKLFNLYLDNNIDLLQKEIIQLIKIQPALPVLLLGTDQNDEAVSEEFTRWLIQQKEIFPRDQDLLDLGLRASMYKWWPYGVELFVELGAEPNQEILTKRTPLDLAYARSDFGYFGPEEGELERTIELLLNAGGKHYLELAFREKIACQSVFDHLPLYDSWAEAAISDISKLDLYKQELYSKLFSACLNKAKKYSKNWWKSTTILVDEIGRSEFLKCLVSWLLESCKPRESHIYGYTGKGNLHRYSYMPQELDTEIWMISEKSSTLLKSLLWLTELMNAKERASLLQSFSASMFTTYFSYGIRSPKLASHAFSLMIQSPEGHKLGLKMLEECNHKPSIKRMKAAFKELDGK